MLFAYASPSDSYRTAAFSSASARYAYPLLSSPASLDIYFGSYFDNKHWIVRTASVSASRVQTNITENRNRIIWPTWTPRNQRRFGRRSPRTRIGQHDAALKEFSEAVRGLSASMSELGVRMEQICSQVSSLAGAAPVSRHGPAASSASDFPAVLSFPRPASPANRLFLLRSDMRGS